MNICKSRDVIRFSFTLACVKTNQWKQGRKTVVKFKHSTKTTRWNIFHQSGIFNLMYQLISCEFNLNLFPFCFGHFSFLCPAWIEAYSVRTSNSYSFVTVTDRISYIDSASKYCKLPETYQACGYMRIMFFSQPVVLCLTIFNVSENLNKTTHDASIIIPSIQVVLPNRDEVSLIHLGCD